MAKREDMAKPALAPGPFLSAAEVAAIAERRVREFARTLQDSVRAGITAVAERVDDIAAAVAGTCPAPEPEQQVQEQERVEEEEQEQEQEQEESDVSVPAHVADMLDRLRVRSPGAYALMAALADEMAAAAPLERRRVAMALAERLEAGLRCRLAGAPLGAGGAPLCPGP